MKKPVVRITRRVIEEEESPDELKKGHKQGVEDTLFFIFIAVFGFCIVCLLVFGVGPR